MVRTERGGDVHRVDTGGGPSVYRHDRRGTYHAWVEFDRRDPVLSALVPTVGLATATDPLELNPLSTAIDPDALEQLLSHWDGVELDRAHATLGFAYENCDIRIRADGEVVVTPPNESS